MQKNGTGIIKLEGYAKSTADIEEVGRVLSEAGYGVKAYSPVPISASAPEYTIRVNLELSLPEAKEGQSS